MVFAIYEFVRMNSGKSGDVIPAWDGFYFFMMSRACEILTAESIFREDGNHSACASDRFFMLYD